MSRLSAVILGICLAVLGCGVDVEGCESEGFAVACGMGFTPEVSSRFLWFYDEA